MHIFTFANLSAFGDCLHGITEKHDTYAYDFSLALHTGQRREAIVANRAALLADIGAAEWDVVMAEQTHGNRVGIVEDRTTRGWTEAETAIPDTDALVTNKERLLLGILTADCVPILLYDPDRRVVGAVHAGWRGTAAHIVSKTVETMVSRYDASPSRIVAGIGPAIGGCCYEVDEAVAKHFVAYPQSSVKSARKYYIDLKDINKYQLIEAGILPDNIEINDCCTACDNERFFSYRKECGCKGRFLSFIGLV